LERDLLLLQDLQGVVATATLRPGTEVGTADLIVHLTPGRHFQGSVDVDNFGSMIEGVRLRASWAWRLGESPTQSVPDSPSRGWIQVGLDF